MAHLRDGDNLNKNEVYPADRNCGFIKHPDLDAKFRIRPMFDEVVSVFLEEVPVNKDAFRPLPPRLGDGREVDLFKLFWVVRRMGGYEEVSEKELWEDVAWECELGVGVMASLRLIYIKYLKELDEWLSEGRFRDMKKESISIGLLEKLDSLYQELEGCKGPSCSGEEKAKAEDEVDEKGKCVGVELGDNEAALHMVVVENASGIDADSILGKIEVECLDINDDEKLSTKHEKGVGSSHEDVVDEVLINSGNGVPLSGKSDKDVDLSKIEVGSSANVDERFSEKDDNRVLSFAKNVVKEVASFDSDNNIPFSAKDGGEDKITPPGCNDSVVSLKAAVEKLVSSDKRKREDEKQAVSAEGNIATVSGKTDAEKDGTPQKKMKADGSFALSAMLNWIADAARNPHSKAIRTLPHSSKWGKYGRQNIWKQALLARKAIFTEMGNNEEKEHLGLQGKKQRSHPDMYTDHKIPSVRCSQRVTSVKLCTCPGCILGSTTHSKQKAESPKTPTRRLPASSNTHESITENADNTAVIRVGPAYQAHIPEWTGTVSDSDPKWLGTQMCIPEDDEPLVGKGRGSSCRCLFPNSAQCARFHVAENRYRLTRSLGPLFHQWGFHQMGEEVALSWTREEELEFKKLIAKTKQDVTQVNSVQEIMSRFWHRASISLPTKTSTQLVGYYFNVFMLRRRCYQNRVTPQQIDSDDDETELGSIGVSLSHDEIHGLTIKCSVNKCMDFDYD